MPIRNMPFMDDGSGLLRPYLPIKIINPNTGKSQKMLGLIDTGADECTLPAELAPLLGHDLERGKPKSARTAGGSALGYSHTTIIEIHSHANVRLYTTPVIVIDYMKGLHIPLLGVKYFLENFELHIDYPKKVFTINWPK